MKFDRIKAGHLTLHGVRVMRGMLGTLAAAVEKLRARQDEEKRMDLEGVRGELWRELAVLRERMTEEIERWMTEELPRRNQPQPPVSEGRFVPPAPKAGLH